MAKGKFEAERQEFKLHIAELNEKVKAKQCIVCVCVCVRVSVCLCVCVSFESSSSILKCHTQV